MIDAWLRIPYRRFGRDETGADCWGLVRIVRAALCGEVLPSYGAVDPDDKAQMTSTAGEIIAAGFVNVAPRPGAIAAVWRGGFCVHAGIVIAVENRLAVLETNQATGVRWMRVSDFEARYPRVSYHDRDIPLQPAG